jgi:uncharacterized Zn-binding protein involved in type VI secretion
LNYLFKVKSFSPHFICGNIKCKIKCKFFLKLSLYRKLRTFMPAAARISDNHFCPIVPGTPLPPHSGGPIMPPGVPTVLIGGLPAATIGSMCTCIGSSDTIVKGSTSVMIGGKPAARQGDSTAHGGSIVSGCATVIIGG